MGKERIKPDTEQAIRAYCEMQFNFGPARENLKTNLEGTINLPEIGVDWNETLFYIKGKDICFSAKDYSGRNVSGRLTNVGHNEIGIEILNGNEIVGTADMSNANLCRRLAEGLNYVRTTEFYDGDILPEGELEQKITGDSSVSTTPEVTQEKLNEWKEDWVRYNINLDIESLPYQELELVD